MNLLQNLAIYQRFSGISYCSNALRMSIVCKYHSHVAENFRWLNILMYMFYFCLQKGHEKEVDKYFFLHFEKVAENLKWPKEHWTVLLQSVVISKVREIYTQLSLEQSSNYDKVKELILKGYELVPEAYMQEFRDCRKNMTRLMWNLLEQKSNYLIGGALQRK